MKRREFVVSSALGSLGILASGTTATALSMTPRPERAATRKILIAGGNYNTSFIRYMAELTGKKRPKILYLPTASADSDASIVGFYKSCAPLDVEPSYQLSFIESLSQTRGWDEVLLSVDGILCSGGNTLNQQAIWKAQGIDVVLRQAWVGIKQIGQRGGAKPMPVQPPLAAGRKQAVEREHAQNLLPVRAFTTDAQARGEEGVELEFAPELVARASRRPRCGAGRVATGPAAPARRACRCGRACGPRERARTGGNCPAVHRRPRWTSARRRAGSR